MRESSSLGAAGSKVDNRCPPRDGIRMNTAAAFCVTGAVLFSAIALRGQAPPPVSVEFSRWSPLCQGVEHTASVALGDLDRDGDLDLVVGSGRHFRELDSVYINDGRGMFYGKRTLGSEPDGTYGVALGDVDADGTLDAVVVNDLGNRSVVYRNDGVGNFSLLASLGKYPGVFSHERRAVALGDLDSDGDLDVVAVGVSQDHIYLNEQKGREWREQPFGGREPGTDPRSTGVALGDLDHDGDLDIVLPGRYESRSFIYLNDGHGGFSERREFGTAADDTTGAVLSDFNNDGYLDLAAVNWRQPHQLYLNDGKGQLRQSGTTFGTAADQAWSVAAADFDGDGDVDLVVGNSNIGYWSEDLSGDGRPDRGGNTRADAPSRIYWNDGVGRLSAGPAVGIGSDDTRPVAVGDVDSDGDVDIVMGNDCQPNQVFFNSLRAPAALKK